MRLLVSYMTGVKLGFRHQLELLFSILIIGILAGCALTIYSQYQKKAVVTQFSGYKSWLNAAHVYYALHGVWPESTEDLTGDGHTGWILNDPKGSDSVGSVSVTSGSVDFSFEKHLKGKVLTLRPAVPANNPSGPVIWVCGGDDRAGRWQLIGEDRTDIGDDGISRYLR